MKTKSVAIIAILVIVSFQVQNVFAHSMFNSAEEFIGENRVQIATLPEFPQIGEKSQILLRVTDEDFNEVDRITLGMRVFFNDKQIFAVPPTSIEGSHFETDFVFENSGIHTVKVDLYKEDGIVTYTFNIGTQSPFGYIFIISITIGASIFAIVIGYIYVPKFLKSKFRS